MDPIGENWAECQRLIDVLVDKSARWDERDDAAMDLADVDEPEALEALLQVGRDEKEDDTLLEAVGEAIAEIVGRHPERRTEAIQGLAPPALKAYRSWPSRNAR